MKRYFYYEVGHCRTFTIYYYEITQKEYDFWVDKIRQAPIGESGTPVFWMMDPEWNASIYPHKEFDHINRYITKELFNESLAWVIKQVEKTKKG